MKAGSEAFALGRPAALSFPSQTSVMALTRGLPRKRLLACGVGVAIVVISSGCGSVPGAEGQDSGAATAARGTPSAGVTPGLSETPLLLPGEDPDPGESPLSPGLSPEITSATAHDGVITLNTVVPGVIEDGGQCEVVATSPAGKVVSVVVEAFADASTTVCEPADLSVADGTSGSWSVVVRYRSVAGEGSSAPVQVEVP